MGTKNYLIEGGSGTGKTSVATELERRGHHVVHGDRVLTYVGDPETGQALAGPPEGADRIVWGYVHWIWRVDKVRAIAADTTHPATFFCGGSLVASASADRTTVSASSRGCGSGSARGSSRLPTRAEYLMPPS